MYELRFSKQAQKDAKRLKSAGLQDKTLRLLELLQEDPFKQPPRYESLVGDLEGLFSRRINLQHRLVYEVLPDIPVDACKNCKGTVKVLRMWSHYEGL